MITIGELQDSVQKAFPAGRPLPDRAETWRIVTEMGWLMADLPTDLGGLGLGREAAATISFELGHVLSSAPLIPAVLALQAIVVAPDLADRQGWCTRICGGEYVPLNLLPGTIRHRDDGRLSGRIAGVLEADMASHVLAGAAEFYALIPLDAPGVQVIERAVWDRSRQLFDVVLEGTELDPAFILARGEAANKLHDLLSPGAQLLLAADALGGASASLAMTIEYLKTRIQFKRPLAMFQALKHRCADLKAGIVSAEALLWSRALDPDATPTDFGALKAHACSLYATVVEEAIQLHGGIGLTEEHPCHLFMKRAMLNVQLCGDTDHWQEVAGRAALAAVSSTPPTHSIGLHQHGR